MTATATRPKLPEFEDQDVHGATVRITNAGDGLSEALKVEPKALHLGQEVFYVLAGDVSQINHIDRDGVLTRVHTVKASRITEVDGDMAKKILAAAADDLQKRRDEIDGQMRLDDEAAAAEREAADGDADPADVAQNAAQRVKSGE